MTFTVGEEVVYGGERFVIAGIDPSRPYPYRLLATTPKGARIVWAKADQLGKLVNYTTFAPERPRVSKTAQPSASKTSARRFPSRAASSKAR